MQAAAMSEVARAIQGLTEEVRELRLAIREKE